MKKQRRKHDYLDKETFTNQVLEYVAYAKACEAEGKRQPIITNEVAIGIQLICNNLAKAGNFANYPFREDMVSDAIEVCLKAVPNFNVEAKTRSGTPNAFGYFSRIAYFAFLQRIKKEKRELAIKNAYLERSTVADFITNGEGSTQYFETARTTATRSDKFIASKKTIRAPRNTVIGPLDRFF